MGTSNTEFSLLLAAFSLNSTWTPLVGGILAGRLGTTLTSIIATGVIFVGTCDPGMHCFAQLISNALLQGRLHSFLEMQWKVSVS